MKRWKITTAKPVPVTCENCEEGRYLVCLLYNHGELLIRERRGDWMFDSNGERGGTVAGYTFLRYLDPDPETPRQVRFADVSDGVVFTVTACGDLLFWKSSQATWTCNPHNGERSMETGPTYEALLVTLTGQVAELVEEE